jgi:2-oxoglutarate dehydrogenase E2 component (dihydrolipoamide succinyltransferase)/2-oxoisovalerate dehydrogenase E2 component (dihydrolipoyl transacylase)
MAIDIIMPQLGESVAEGTIIKWCVAPGDHIEKDQPLLEVETDKVSLDIPSPQTGTLSEVLVPVGHTVPVGTVLARLAEGAAAETGIVNRVGGVVVRPSEPWTGEKDHYSPAVRQLAKEHNVLLSEVAGSGAGGRVTRKDVLAFVAARAPAQAPAKREKADTAEETVVPLTQMRKTIAERMVKSKQAAPHVATFFEADFSEIAKFRSGRSLTYLPFVIHAAARALTEVPILNASWSEAGIIVKKSIHVGIAVALEEGLLVPVIRDADRKSLGQLAKEAADLAERARTKKLTPDEVQGGTFTITNHGGSGSLFSTPIIHQPQIAILGVGAVQKRAVVINEAIAIRPMCYLSLSFDHRVIDGAIADHFVTKVKQHLEHSQWEEGL